jgi:hypothetical protein
MCCRDRIVTENDELVENGVQTLGSAAVGLGLNVIGKVISGESSEEENQDFNNDSDFV